MSRPRSALSCWLLAGLMLAGFFLAAPGAEARPGLPFGSLHASEAAPPAAGDHHVPAALETEALTRSGPAVPYGEPLPPAAPVGSAELSAEGSESKPSGQAAIGEPIESDTARRLRLLAAPIPGSRLGAGIPRFKANCVYRL